MFTHWWAILAAHCFLAACVHVRADQAMVLRIVDTWLARQESVRTARFQSTGNVLHPRGSQGASNDGQPAPLLDTETDRKLMLLLDLEHGKIRKEVHSESWMNEARLFKPTFEILTYNGKDFRRAEPPAENTSKEYKPSELQPQLFMHSEPKKLSQLFNMGDYPLFFATGCVLPRIYLQQASEWTDLKPSAEMFSPSGATGALGKGIVTLRTRPVPENPNTLEEFQVDMNRGCVITQWKSFWKGRPMGTLDVDYEQRDGFWLPITWKTVGFQGGKPTWISKYELNDFAFDVAVDAAQFELSTPPKAVIIRDGKLHRTRSDSSIPPPTSVAQLHEDARDEAARRHIWIYSAIATVAVAFAALLWRIRKSWLGMFHGVG